MAKKAIYAKDCSPIKEGSKEKNKVGDEKYLTDIPTITLLRNFCQKFRSPDSNMVLHLSGRARKGDAVFAEERFVSEKNEDGHDIHVLKWFAGRWIGKGKYDNLEVEIEPRFGTEILLCLLKEDYNYQLSDKLQGEQANGVDHLLNLLIGFIWANKLSNANKYGIPTRNVAVEHKGKTIKGRLNVRKSILPYRREREVYSTTWEKCPDEVIANIILQAERFILRNCATKDRINATPNAKNALDNLHSLSIHLRHISVNEYKRINYKSVFESYRPIVDLSWQLIQQKGIIQQDSETKKEAMGMFVDMAEIWEMFLRSKLRQRFPEWSVSSPEEKVYEGKFFERNIIPDILMERGDQVAVFDAKWKRMSAEKSSVELSDLDRSDFFQIHTYTQYYQESAKKVVACGLLYPLQKDYDPESMRSDTLFGVGEQEIPFVVCGIKCVSGNDAAEFEQNTEIFLDQIANLLE